MKLSRIIAMILLMCCLSTVLPAAERSTHNCTRWYQTDRLAPQAHNRDHKLQYQPLFPSRILHLLRAHNQNPKSSP